MHIGVVFPQTEFPPDPISVRDYAQAVEDLGYTHILAYEHVLGANPDRPTGWEGPYTYLHPFLEPFILFSHMAAVTRQTEFVTGVLVLPQRQTALVAKQAATLDVLCNGRLRLGIGNGWNEVEYQALGKDFRNRGRRIEEQVNLLRQLWAEPLVTFSGHWESIPDAGINPLPVRRSIPIWFGGHADIVLRRAAHMGDGWMPTCRTAEQAHPALEMLRGFLEEAGRDPSAFGIEPRLNMSRGDPAEWSAIIAGWEEAGASHLSVNTMGCDFTSPAEHLQALRSFKNILT
ncbi:MAG: LLM class F420-dependent oxidoreductase [Anaerolineales bacterium]|nr:LLM class F420-dependent oxidoreductase [Anaerolineales bacterium]